MILQRRRILVTGPASQVGFPVAEALARSNRVFGLARFGRAADRERVAKAGIEPIAVDLADGDLGGVPDDVEIVLHFAVVKSGRFDYDLRANAEGVGRLFSRCRRAEAFLHCSTAGVYAHLGPDRPAREGDPLGDNHRAMLPTYSLSKIAAESVAAFAAREFGVPTTIARLSVPYGANGGWPAYHLALLRAGRAVPIHPERPNRFNPIHEDDIVAQIPRLLAIAATPPTVVNWGGEPASIEEWCAYLGELAGLEVRFEETERTVAALPIDLERMHALVGPAKIGWREGMRRMLRAA